MAAQEESPSAANALPRVEAGWVGQLVAAVILVIVTIVGTLAVVKMLEGERRSAPPKTEAPR